MDLEDCEMNRNIKEFIRSLNKFFSRINEMDTIYDIWKICALKINIKLLELFELSIDDHTFNISLAMKVLDILDIL